MNTRLNLPSVVGLFLTAAVILETLPAARGEDAFELAPEAIAKLQLAFEKVEPRPLHRIVPATGAVRLDETRVIDVVPRIAGLVAADHQSLGATVVKGDPLFTLESAGLSETITAYVDAEQAMAFANNALAQEKTLFDRNLSSKENLQARELEFQKAVASHARALQPLKLLHFDEGSIHRYLADVTGGDYTTLKVTAPEAGEIIEKSLRRGASVEPSETVYTIADLSRLWVDFRVSLRDAVSVSKGQVVTVESSVSRGTAGDATIAYIAPVADEATRTVLVRANLENVERSWRPGTPVTVSFVAELGEPVLSVPISSIVDLGGGKAVFLREGETAFRAAIVEAGESDGKNTRILSGLEAGQTVVSANAAQLKGHLEMTND